MGETMGRFRQFVVEYVGNLHPFRIDRRNNWHARSLIDWIKGQMEARGFTPAEQHEVVRDLRQALQQDGPEMNAGESSRDAPS
jgi:hypothetical protein